MYGFFCMRAAVWRSGVQQCGGRPPLILPTKATRNSPSVTGYPSQHHASCMEGSMQLNKVLFDSLRPPHPQVACGEQAPNRK